MPFIGGPGGLDLSLSEYTRFIAAQGLPVYLYYRRIFIVNNNKPVKEIADMLEEEISVIAPVFALLQTHPDWDDEEICKELRSAGGSSLPD